MRCGYGTFPFWVITLAEVMVYNRLAPKHITRPSIHCAGIYPGEMDGFHKAGFAPHGYLGVCAMPRNLG